MEVPVLEFFAFTRPFALLAVPFAIWAVLAFRRKQVGWPLRIASFTAMVLALAGFSLRVEPTSVAVLVDVSDSAGTNALRTAQQLDFAVNDDRVSWYVVGASTAHVNEPIVPAALDTSATALAEGLLAAEAAGAKRILVVSDGLVNQGELLARAPLVPVDTLPVLAVDDVGFTEVIAPESYTPGTRTELTAIVHSTVDTEAVLITRTLEHTERQDVTLTKGYNHVPVTVSVASVPGAVLPVEVQLDVPFTQPTQNDTAEVSLVVASSDEVLVLGDEALARLLEQHGIAVMRGTAADIVAPLTHSMVAIRGSATEFSRGQLGIIADYLTNGGGLLMTGGPESFGFGGWQRTELESLLPVDSDIQTNVLQPQVAMVMIIDRSNSMNAGRPTRIALAREGAMQVVELAYHKDLLGVLAFADPANTAWIFEPRPATDRGKREMLSMIARIEPNGGTVLEPGYRMAIEALTDIDAAVRHIVILSDGQLYDGSPMFGGGGMPDFFQIARDAAELGITTSTIALGNEADFVQLSRIADGGYGRYYEALDAAGLPRIFTAEALQTNRALLVEERLVPVLHPNPFGSPDEPLGALEAYIATHAKADAQMVLEADRNEAVLATRNVSLGRAAALTTDLNQWSGALGDSASFQELLLSTVRWLQTEPTRYSATAERTGNRVRIVLDAVQDGEFLLSEHLTGRFGGVTFPLEQRTPGRYEAEVAWPGDRAGDVVISFGTEVVARTGVHGADPEFLPVDGAMVLAALSERTGGNRVNAIDVYDPDLPSSTRELTPWLVLFVVASLLAEVAWRRFARA